MQKKARLSFSQPLDARIKESARLPQLYRSELRFGDLVGVRTQNSVYAIGVLENDAYLVSGGWFDKQGVSPRPIAINGCTWGGSAIKQDIVAACGLCLEFGNGLVTSPIAAFQVFRHAEDKYKKRKASFPGGNDHDKKNDSNRRSFSIDNKLGLSEQWDKWHKRRDR